MNARYGTSAAVRRNDFPAVVAVIGGGTGVANAGWARLRTWGG